MHKRNQEIDNTAGWAFEFLLEPLILATLPHITNALKTQKRGFVTSWLAHLSSADLFVGQPRSNFFIAGFRILRFTLALALAFFSLFTSRALAFSAGSPLQCSAPFLFIFYAGSEPC